RPSTAYIRPNASIPQYSTVDPIRPSQTSNMAPPNGWTGTTNDGSTVVSDISARLNVRPPITRLSTGSRDPQNSGRKPRALHHQDVDERPGTCATLSAAPTRSRISSNIAGVVPKFNRSQPAPTVPNSHPSLNATLPFLTK